MYQHYKKCHCTHLLLDAENKALMVQVDELKNEEELKKYPWAKMQSIQNRLRKKQEIINTMKEKPIFGIAVDGFCSGNPGPCGYRGVDISTGEILFSAINLGYGTNNIAEFLGIVHALGFIKHKGGKGPVYSDSEIAIAWVNKKQTNTTADAKRNPTLTEKIWKCEMFLLDQKSVIIVNKWDTKNWGEIPADFGNKR